MLSLEQLRRMVDSHLTSNELDITRKWIVSESPLGGRGLIATENIETGEVIFVDHPLIYGPRSGSTVQRGCNVCCKIESDSFLKCDNCALLLCSETCKNSEQHSNDCDTISRWTNKVPIADVDDTMMSKALTAIRALLLTDEQKELMHYLEAHCLPRNGAEIKDLKQYFEIPEAEEELTILACCVLDANAFQIATPYGKLEMSMRGLYPVAGLMNHNCVPNTKYSYQNGVYMTVKAVKPIRAGMEIFTCYTGLLWGTPARRMHLYKTKHFFCNCERCTDPTERGTLLAALKCLSPTCPGSLLPIDPLNVKSTWQCLDCGMRVPFKNISAVQSALGSLMGSLDFRDANELENFLMNRAFRYIPRTNQIIVDLQCRLIWELGETPGLMWHELPEARLALKESLCRGTLRTLAALAVGDAHLRGLLLYHLHAALAEKARRAPHLYEELKSEIETTIEQAYNILKDDISSPPDLELRRRYLGPDCDKSHEERFFILDK